MTATLCRWRLVLDNDFHVFVGQRPVEIAGSGVRSKGKVLWQEFPAITLRINAERDCRACRVASKTRSTEITSRRLKSAPAFCTKFETPNGIASVSSTTLMKRMTRMPSERAICITSETAQQACAGLSCEPRLFEPHTVQLEKRAMPQPPIKPTALEGGREDSRSPKRVPSLAKKPAD